MYGTNNITWKKLGGWLNMELEFTKNDKKKIEKKKRKKKNIQG
jgi:hypothetical protein